MCDIKQTVGYKFEVDQEVITSFGGIGRVELIGCGVDGITYFLNDRWFKERDLKPATTELTE